MDLQDILAKITALKEKNATVFIDFKIEEKDDFVDLYVVAYEEDEPVADDLLLSIQEPKQSDLDELDLIVKGLKDFV